MLKAAFAPDSGAGILRVEKGLPIKMVENAKEQGKAEVWWSSEAEPRSREWFARPFDIPYRLERQADAEITAPSPAEGETLAIFPERLHQEILGIGTSMEESTVFNLARMSESKREEICRSLVDRERGAGFNLIRITLGTSDFTARAFYSYNDLEPGETDFELERFSIRKDIEYGIIDVLRRLRELQPELLFFASSWSPPAWMKTSGSLMRGQLKEGEQYTRTLAKYYRMAIQAYREQGIELYAITVQNEPLLEIDYPSCYMSPQRQTELIAALREELDEHGLRTKIWIFDHNFADAWAYVSPILNDAAGRAAADGIAFHDYDGEPTVMRELQCAYPDLSIHLTERSLWGVEAADRFVQYFRSGASSYNAWVTMLDSRIGTHQWVGTPDPTLIVQDAEAPERFWMTPEFYLTAQFSKFVPRGARRADSSPGSAETVTHVAFVNPDGTVVAVVVNRTDRPQPFRLLCEGRQIRAALPPKTAGTYRWRRAPADTD
ncbi:glycoside hydrolase family 30 beta sandwich domain-containing protein [Cohnella cellulosilytica]